MPTVLQSHNPSSATLKVAFKATPLPALIAISSFASTLSHLEPLAGIKGATSAA